MLRERVVAPLPSGLQSIGVEAAGRSLEDVVRPLTAEEDEGVGAKA